MTTSYINDCTWGNLAGYWTPDPLKCRKCDLKMSLHPVNKQEPPLYWLCDRHGEGCNRKLFCTEIIDAFIQAQIDVEHRHQCKIMAFAVDEREIRIEITSDEYYGESRTVSKPRFLRREHKDDIQDELLDYISAVLSIEIDDLSDLFQT